MTILTFPPFFFFFFNFLFFLPQIEANSCHASHCDANALMIRFPFRLIDHQPLDCGYSNGFDLSCNIHNQTILTLPSSGDFIVETISYTNQYVWINDNYCFVKRFLNKSFSLLEGSPFEFSLDLQEYTFYKCPSGLPSIFWSSTRVPCLDDGYYVVFASSPAKPLEYASLCFVVTAARVPADIFELTSFDLGVKLTWKAPECGACEASGKVCGFRNGSRTKLDCFKDTYHQASSGITKGAKYGIAVGVLGLVSITAYVAFFASTSRGELPEGDHGQRRPQESTTELSSIVTNRHPRVLIPVGLDRLTIESYPKTQLGEALELPNPNEKMCSICLGEYQPNETVRTIPECKHYFHSNCIDEWLGKHPTCPICRILPGVGRNPPEEVPSVRENDE